MPNPPWEAEVGSNPGSTRPTVREGAEVPDAASAVVDRGHETRTVGSEVETNIDGRFFRKIQRGHVPACMDFEQHGADAPDADGCGPAVGRECNGPRSIALKGDLTERLPSAHVPDTHIGQVGPAIDAIQYAKDNKLNRVLVIPRGYERAGAEDDVP